MKILNWKIAGFIVAIFLGANAFGQHVKIGQCYYTLDKNTMTATVDSVHYNAIPTVIITAKVKYGGEIYQVKLKDGCMEGHEALYFTFRDGLEMDCVPWGKNKGLQKAKKIVLPKMAGKVWDVPEGFINADFPNLGYIEMPAFDYITKYHEQKNKGVCIDFTRLSDAVIVFKESFHKLGLLAPGERGNLTGEELNAMSDFILSREFTHPVTGDQNARHVFYNFMSSGERDSLIMGTYSFWGTFEQWNKVGCYVDTLDFVLERYPGLATQVIFARNALIKDGGAVNIWYDEHYYSGKEPVYMLQSAKGKLAGIPICLDSVLFGEEGAAIYSAVDSVTIEKNLPTEKWSFIGNMSKTNKYEFLDDNYGMNFNKVHAFAANEYDYSTNGWKTEFSKYQEATPAKYSGFLVWPFKELLGADVNNPEISDEDTVVLQYNTNTYYLSPFDSIEFDLVNNGGTYGGGRFFALSNPYYANINMRDFVIRNHKEMQGFVVYIWDNTLTTPDWKTIDIETEDDASLAPATGFMVASAGAKTNVHIKFDFCQIPGIYDKGKVYKSAKDNRISLAVNANGVEKTMWARVNENSEDGFDGEDGYYMESANPDAVSPYFVIDGRNVVDNYFKTLPYEFNVNFASTKVNDIELSLKEVPENIEVTLIDVLNDNKETLISTEEAINLTVFGGENSGKYKVRFAKKNNLGIGDLAQSENNVTITTLGDEIAISGSNLTYAQVINTLGQVVYAQQLSGNEAKINANLTAGAYLVKVSSANGDKTEKIIIK